MTPWTWDYPTEGAGEGWSVALTVRCGFGHRVARLLRVPGDGLVLVDTRARVMQGRDGSVWTGPAAMKVEREDAPAGIVVRCGCRGSAMAERVLDVAEMFDALEHGRRVVVATWDHDGALSPVV